VDSKSYLMDYLLTVARLSELQGWSHEADIG